MAITEQNMHTSTVLETADLNEYDELKPVMPITITPRLNGLIATSEVLYKTADTEFDNITELIPKRMEPMFSMVHLNTLQETYEKKLINPTYEGRLWGLYSFGDRYMQQDFMRMNQIKKKIWEIPVYLRFMDDNQKRVPIEQCTLISFDRYPTHNCALMRHISEIEIKDGICHLKVIHKGIKPIDVYLYEETTMILKG